jgi:hypothetical protein
MPSFRWRCATVRRKWGIPYVQLLQEIPFGHLFDSFKGSVAGDESRVGSNPAGSDVTVAKVISSDWTAALAEWLRRQPAIILLNDFLYLAQYCLFVCSHIFLDFAVKFRSIVSCCSLASRNTVPRGVLAH